ncbi:MAG TPA: GrpB family protein [Aquabacterium sp.]|nr:GrpB family protein [Aquabacterium sp.]HQC96356.1 GrpB family protein [Aquabacterium sp.]
MADDPIVLAPPDPRWAALFAAERDAIAAALAPWLAGAPEHIGSTAVPGLPAKPVIDIMAPVVSLDASRAAIAAAASLQYAYVAYQADRMHWFCKPGPVNRTHHLHLVPVGSALWRERLAFRDALRADTALRDAYADLKRRLAAAHPQDREAYTDAKGPFVAAVLAASLR